MTVAILPGEQVPNQVYLVDARPFLASHGYWVRVRIYDDATKEWLARSGHYLDAPPPGALLVISLEQTIPGLFGPVPGGGLRGLAVLGRPIARNLPQDGAVAELTRFVLVPDLPHETASHVLRVAVETWFGRPTAQSVITYHDRTRHTGCIYKKAGFKKDGYTRKATRRGTWNSRPGREQATSSEVPNKRRWKIDRDGVVAAIATRSTTDSDTTEQRHNEVNNAGAGQSSGSGPVERGQSVLGHDGRRSPLSR